MIFLGKHRIKRLGGSRQVVGGMGTDGMAFPGAEGAQELLGQLHGLQSEDVVLRDENVDHAHGRPLLDG